MPASTNSATSSAHQASHRYSAPTSTAVLVAETELAESAQVARAAERRLQIERHRLVAVGIGEDALGPQREHAIAARQRHVLLQTHVDSVKIELAEIAIVELRGADGVPAAGVRMRRVVAPVECGGQLAPSGSPSVCRGPGTDAALNTSSIDGKRLSCPVPTRGREVARGRAEVRASKAASGRRRRSRSR